MPHGEILHICLLDKFIPPFIEFIKENFEFERHTFHLSGDIDKYSVTKGTNVCRSNSKFSLINSMNGGMNL
jgi:hypothetical protein